MNRTAIFLPGLGSPHHSVAVQKQFLSRLTMFTDIYCIFETNLGINQPIPALTYQLYSYIHDSISIERDEKITFIGHSMGGLLAIDLLQTYSDIRAATNALITIASPLKGANKSVYLPSVFSRSASDMIPNSQFLQNLATQMPVINDIPKLYMTASLDILVPAKNTYFESPNSLQQTIRSNHLSILFKKRTVEEINGWTQYKIYNGHNTNAQPKLLFTTIPQI